MGQFTADDGARLAYTDDGRGLPLLALAGLGDAIPSYNHCQDLGLTTQTGIASEARGWQLQIGPGLGVSSALKVCGLAAAGTLLGEGAIIALLINRKPAILGDALCKVKRKPIGILKGEGIFTSDYLAIAFLHLINNRI